MPFPHKTSFSPTVARITHPKIGPIFSAAIYGTAALAGFMPRNGKRGKHGPLFRTERRSRNEPTELLLICESDGALLIYDRRREQKRIAPIPSFRSRCTYYNRFWPAFNSSLPTQKIFNEKLRIKNLFKKFLNTWKQFQIRNNMII